MDDLLQLVSLAGHGPATERSSEPALLAEEGVVVGVAERPSDGEWVGEAVAAVVQLHQPVDPEVEGLEEVLGLVAAPRQKKHQQRSWQLCEKARAKKAKLKVERELQVAKQQAASSNQVIAQVQGQFPSVAQALGLRPTRAPMDESRARIVQRLAFMPAFRGANPARGAQARALGLVCQAALDLQRRCVQNMALRPPAPPDGLEQLASGVRLVCLTWQWDETTQRLKSLQKPKLRNEKASSEHVSMQVMMQSGSMVAYESAWAGDAQWEVDKQSILCKGLLLERQTASFLVGGVGEAHAILDQGADLRH